MHIFSPLRYPGGKGKLGPWFAALIEQNGFHDYTFVEPYAGGAGSALYLLLKGHVPKIHINDLDPAIHAFWYAVLNETDRFLKHLDAVKVDLENWHKYKQILKSPHKYSQFDLGFAAFFLNRTNVSGILDSGPIGGKEQKSKYKIDARFNKAALGSRIEAVASRKEDILLTNLDALELLHHYKSAATSKAFIYLDPPYFQKGSQLYRNFYTLKDHQLIHDVITTLPHPWVVTYDNHDTIRSIYAQYPLYSFSLRYSASPTHRKFGSELLFYHKLHITSAPQLTRRAK
jgi:DNA adenine methylase